MRIEDRQYSYSDEQRGTLITYSTGVSAEGTPQESMINVGMIKGGVVFPAVEAIYSSNGRLDAYMAHNGDQLEWKKPKENALRDIDNKFVVKDILLFESISLPLQVAGLPEMLEKGKVTKDMLTNYAVGITPRGIETPDSLRRIEPKTRMPKVALASTGDQ